MNLETKLWKRSKRSWGTTIPHQLLFNLNLPESEYKVIWKFNNKIGKWTVSFEEGKGPMSKEEELEKLGDALELAVELHGDKS